MGRNQNFYALPVGTWNSAATVGITAAPQNVIENYHVMQKLHFWVYSERNDDRESNRCLYTQFHSSAIQEARRQKQFQCPWMYE